MKIHYSSLVIWLKFSIVCTKWIIESFLHPAQLASFIHKNICSIIIWTFAVLRWFVHRNAKWTSLVFMHHIVVQFAYRLQRLEVSSFDSLNTYTALCRAFRAYCLNGGNKAGDSGSVNTPWVALCARFARLVKSTGTSLHSTELAELRTLLTV